MNQTIGILLVDGASESRAQLRKEMILAGLSVVGEASSSQEAFGLAKGSSPNAIVVSVEEPLARGLHNIETLALALPDIPIIAVSTKKDRDLFRKAVLAGARDFLDRPMRGNALVQSVEAVMSQGEKRRQSQSSPDVSRLAKGTIVSVFGPKGGVGKTTLAINLAVCMATESKQRVVVVDLDTQVGAAAVMLNIIPKRTVFDLVQNLHHMDRDLLKTFVAPHPSGLELLSAASGSQMEEDELTPEDAAHLLSFLGDHYDYVIVDMPPQVNPLVLRTMQESTYILLVTSLEVASIHASKRVLNRIGNWEFAKDKIKLVVNVSNSANSLEASDIEEALGYRVFWSLPYDPNVGMASQTGQPVLLAKPNSKASKAITQLHYTLVGSKPERNRGIAGLFRGRTN